MSFNPLYPYIADYDTWLRIARRHAMHYTPEVLAKWRVLSPALADRLEELLLNPALRNELSERGLDTARQYALSRVAPLFGEALRRVPRRDPAI
jgi:hypothetical protein